MDDFCRDLGSTCANKSVNTKTRITASTRFLFQEAPSISEAEAIFQKNGFIKSKKEKYGQPVFCKAPYFANYELNDGWVRFVVFGVGGDECKAKRM